ncbi:hypothetical protein L9F63_019616, partial [Diploptera punctata]
KFKQQKRLQEYTTLHLGPKKDLQLTNSAWALMEQQVSWAAGRGLTFIRVVQLALSVLNRLMILKQTIKLYVQIPGR